MVVQASDAVGGLNIVTKNLVLHHILQVYADQEKNTAVNINLHLSHPDYMLRQFLLSVRASVFVHEPSRAVLARGTFESIVVTNNCTNTSYYRTAVELLPDGNIYYSALRESKSARECILPMACYLATPCPRDQTQCRVK